MTQTNRVGVAEGREIPQALIRDQDSLGGCQFRVLFAAGGGAFVYTDITQRLRTEQPRDAAVTTPAAPGKLLGKAKLIGCEAYGEVDVYEVPGVDPSVAVMTVDRRVGIAEGQRIPASLLAEH